MPSALLSSISDVFPAEPGDIYLQDKGKPACLIRALTPKALASWRETLVGPHLTWMDTTHFAAAAGEVLLLPNSAGDLEAVLLGLGAKPDRASWLALAEMGLLDLERMKSVEEERRKETAGGGSKGRKQGVQGSKAPPSSGPPRPPSSGRWVG